MNRKTLGRLSLLFILTAVLFLPNAPFPGPAGLEAAEKAEYSRSIKAAGRGSIIGGDVAQARDEAIVDARVRALEQVAGLFIDSETIVQNVQLLDTVIRSRTHGFIKDYRLLEEGKEDDDIYRVEIEAWIVDKETMEGLQGLASDVSVVVQFSESLCGGDSRDRTCENALVSALVARGYNVIDRAQADRIQERDRKLLMESGDAAAAEKVSLKFLSNIIITGRAEAQLSQENAGIVSVRVRPAARAIVADTARVIANVTGEEAKGFGKTCEAAGQKALASACPALAEAVLEEIAKYHKSRRREVVIEVRGLPDPGAYGTCHNLIKALRWVTDVREDGFKDGAGVFRLHYPEKTVYLANRLNRDSGFELVEFTWDRILLKANR